MKPNWHIRIKIFRMCSHQCSIALPVNISTYNLHPHAHWWSRDNHRQGSLSYNRLSFPWSAIVRPRTNEDLSIVSHSLFSALIRNNCSNSTNITRSNMIAAPQENLFASVPYLKIFISIINECGGREPPSKSNQLQNSSGSLSPSNTIQCGLLHSAQIITYYL
jgi:hypothetical protein